MSMRIRRGSVDPTPPPGASFGPLPNPQAIRDGARPNIVTDPGGGITFTSRADLQSKINANPSNTIFVAAGNTTYNWDATVVTNSKHPRIYFLGDPENCLVDANNVDLGGPFSSHIAIGNGGGEIHGGKFRRNAGGHGIAIGINIAGSILVEDVISELNFEIGIATGSLSLPYTVRRAITRNNGRYGMTVGQSTANQWGAKGCLFEDIEIAGNNTRQLNIGGDAGGTKFPAGNRDCIWRRIWAHHNYGSGLWWDGFHGRNLAEDIVSENNRNWGGFVELGFGNSLFQRWYLKDNAQFPDSTGWFADVQFIFSCVDGTLLPNDAGAYGSTVPGGTGVTFRDSVIDCIGRAMGAITHDSHPIPMKHAHFLHNQLWLRNSVAFVNGQVGGYDSDTNQVLANEVMEFDQNEYHVANLATDYWNWGGSGQNAPRDWTEWRAFGKDLNSTLQLI